MIANKMLKLHYNFRSVFLQFNDSINWAMSVVQFCSEQLNSLTAISTEGVLVEHVLSHAWANTFQIGDMIGYLLNSLNLLL